MTWSDWQFTPYTIPQILIGSICLWVAYVSWQRRLYSGAVPFSLLMFSIAMWTLLNTIEKSMLHEEARWLLATFIYAFIFATAPLWFVFGVRFSRRDYLLPSWLKVGLWIMPTVMYALAWTDRTHGLFRSSFKVAMEGSIPVEVVSHGPLYLVNLIYTYGMFFLGSILVIDGLWKRPDRSLARIAVVLAGIFVPIVGNMAFLLRLQPVKYVDMTPIYFAVTGFAAAWMLFEIRIFHVLPVARDFVFDCMRDAIIVLDDRSRILDLNAAARGLLPNPSSSLKNRLLAEVWPQFGPYLPRFSELRQRSVQSAGAMVFQVAGEERHFDVHVLPMLDNGNPVGMLVRLGDVTERHQAEEERRRLERHLRHTQKLESLGMLAGGIAHDFNNLLAVILGNAELARLDVENNPRAVSSLQNVVTAAERAASLASQMLAYSGKGRFLVEKLYVSPFIEEMHHLLSSAVPKPIELELDLAQNLPPILADVNQIRQLIINLVTNAAESIGHRKGTVCVRTRLAEVKDTDLAHAAFSADLQPGKHLMIQVTDTGTGIDEMTLPRIFEPFFSTKFTGRGLGLAVVLGIVRGHGGAIIVDSQRGIGTDIRVLLPAELAESRMPTIAGEPVPAVAAPAHGTILVVDDEKDVRDVACRVLEKSGYKVVEAKDGEDALRIFRKRSREIDAVLLDLTMPSMTGDQVLERLREIDPNVIVVLTSGYEEDAVAERLAGRMPAGFLRKPYRVTELVSKVQTAIGNRKRLTTAASDNSSPSPVS